MKSKAPNTKEVDALASKYFRLKSEAASIVEQQTSLKNGISDLCKKHGKKSGKQEYLEGTNFKVAIITPDPSPVFDEAAFLGSLTVDQRKLVTVRTLSPAKLKKAISEGTISRKAMKPFVTMKNNSPRIHVGPLKDETQNQQED
jgi:hypothetical protein